MPAYRLRLKVQTTKTVASQRLPVSTCDLESVKCCMHGRHSLIVPARIGDPDGGGGPAMALDATGSAPSFFGMCCGLRDAMRLV
jgi:hypothetical protein